MATRKKHVASEPITEPEPVHIGHEGRHNVINEDDSDSSQMREATELSEVYVETSQRDTTQLTIRRLPTTTSQKKKRFQPIRKFWRHQVSVIVPHDSCRDHLALERTFLAWLRTSVSLSMTGVVVAQLFRLHDTGDDSHRKETASTVGVPISAVFNASSILVISIGAYHFWKQQNAIVRSKIHKGGWEMWTIGLLCIAVCGTLLGVMLSIND